MGKKLQIKWSITILPFLNGIFCSVGDKTPFYSNCVKKCKIEICDAGKHSMYQYEYQLGFGFSLWTCMENCEYECQWKTVEAFQQKNWSIPQFKGKWPFIRVLGFQEPASVFFSVLNFIITFKLLYLFNKNVSNLSPYYYIWNIFGLLQLNSWFWSSVYHSKDTDITEKLDYMSAFSVVLYSFYGLGLRYMSFTFNKISIFWSIFCGLIAINHLAYLWFYNFDYGYNMKLNCILGGITLALWILWTFLNFQSQPFVWKIFIFALLMGSTTLLELIDFPPILWLIDAHALWHFSSIFVNIMFYSFIIDDCNYLYEFKTQQIFSSHKTK